jgi:hypothetical protein
LLDAEDRWTPHTLDDAGDPLVDMQEFLISAKSRRRAK